MKSNGTDCSDRVKHFGLALTSKIELMEQYSRRDCLLFHSLMEETGENTTQKVVETAQVMGLNINDMEMISVSHRLQTRIRRHGTPRMIIAKFLHQSVETEILNKRHN